jgi:hypothetical protein
MAHRQSLEELFSMNQTPLYQLRAVERALLEADGIPLLGGMPAISTEAIQESLQSLFGVADLQLEASSPRWAEADESYAAHPQVLGLSCPPLSGALAFLMSAQDVSRLISLLGGPAAREIALLDSAVRGGFMGFLAVEILESLRPFFPPELLPQVSDPSPRITGAVLVIDTRLSASDFVVSGQLLLSSQFCHSLRQTFKARKPTTLSREIARSLTIPIHVLLGETALGHEELRTLRLGDLILLDRTFIDPDSGQGTALLEVAGKVLCGAKLAKGGLILKEIS